MSGLQSPVSAALDADVVICGGGLAGLTLARQIRRELPSMRIVVIERTTRPLPPACHKVGESSVELGSQYLERLGLAEYLQREHIIKFGLRFYPGGGHLPIDQRAELGPANEPIVRSYQIDRGRFEEDLRAMIEQDGVTLHEGAMVRIISLGAGGDPHEITFERGGQRTTLRSRWVVDATGRNAFLKRRMRLKRGTRHAGNAGWFRVEGRVEPGDLVDDPQSPFFAVPMASERWRSTSHLMGEGYWVWLIPLAGGRTSVGIVTHDHVHGFDRVRTHERAMAFLREYEPALARRLDGVEALDFRTLRGYSHGVARSWSHDRWAIVGEAGAFVDPLYSPGTDFIAYANSFTAELMRVDRDGEDLVARTGELNAQYRALVAGSVGIFREAAPVYGHWRAMATKIYWDNFVYWTFACQYYLQQMYRVSGPLYRELSGVGARFVELSGCMQSLFAAWVELAPEAKPRPGFLGLPVFPSLPVDAHLDLQKTMTPEQTLESMRHRLGQAEQMAAELVVRVLVELGPQTGAQLLQEAGSERWTLRYDPERIAAEPLVGLQRRRALSVVARDVERNLGRVERHPQWSEALALLPIPPVAAAETGASASESVAS
ncbi:MAG: NAD(P)/FAD-dependent oxidoreductase [Myxococcota bacterium]